MASSVVRPDPRRAPRASEGAARLSRLALALGGRRGRGRGVEAGLAAFADGCARAAAAGDAGALGLLADALALCARAAAGPDAWFVHRPGRGGHDAGAPTRAACGACAASGRAVLKTLTGLAAHPAGHPLAAASAACRASAARLAVAVLEAEERLAPAARLGAVPALLDAALGAFRASHALGEAAVARETLALGVAVTRALPAARAARALPAVLPRLAEMRDGGAAAAPWIAAAVARGDAAAWLHRLGPGEGSRAALAVFRGGDREAGARCVARLFQCAPHALERPLEELHHAAAQYWALQQRRG